MKLTINRKELISALTAVNKLVNKKHVIPMSDYAHLSVKADRAIVKAFDTSIEIVCAIGCQADSEFEILIDSLKIIELIRKLPEEQINMTFDDVKCIIKSGTNKYQISGLLNPNEYPTIKITEKDKKEGQRIELSTIVFEEGINRVKSFADNDIADKPHLSSVNIIIKDGIMFFYGFDQRRLGKYIIPTSCKENMEFMVPLDVISHLDFSNDDTMIVKTKKHISIISGNTRVSFTQVVMLYPDIDTLLSGMIGSVDYGFSMKTKDAIQSLDRLMLFVNKTSNLCTGEITDKPEIVFSSLDVDFAKEGVESVPFEAGEPFAIKMGFNINNFYNALKQVKTDSVKLGFVTSKVETQNYGRPIIFKQTPVENKEEFIALLMPLSIIN